MTRTSRVLLWGMAAVASLAVTACALSSEDAESRMREMKGDEFWKSRHAVVKRFEGRPIVVTFDSSATNSDIQGIPVAECEHITTVLLRGAQIDDSIVGDLAVFKSLTFLDLSGTKVTDEAMAKLATFKLSKLSVDDTTVSDVGIKAFLESKSLRFLSVQRCRVTADGVMELADKRRLRQVTVGELKLSLEQLRKLRGLKVDVRRD